MVTDNPGPDIMIPSQYHLILAQFHLKLAGTTFHYHLILAQVVIRYQARAYDDSRSLQLLAILLIALCAGCTKAPTHYKGMAGAAGGAAAGALAGQAIGKNSKSTLIGVAIGGLLGYIVGNEWDKYDVQQMQLAYENAPSNEPVVWKNPDNGRQYKMVAQPAVEHNGIITRDATIVAVIDGKEQIVHTSATRQTDGTWKILN